ncbi:DUF4402 domain-containing protein [Sphingomicrobium lutaoense]|uniref:DUF4402 domain-containing protein n=1 Tax=Sphingomicrobium lutaoense TaxID=515949 RepID=A0A839Z5C0_9SPHN|nr:DUF4402 domain-containing protein [Sphingomicrobium lutaoense]MBB3764812.1 hypothetical protein [Sphingomicrobium lutaoense]
MMDRFVLPLAALLHALPFAVAAPMPAAAQCRLCEERSVHVDQRKAGEERIGLQVETILDFDSIVLTGEGFGSATLGANGTRMAEGNVAILSSRAMVGQVVIRGEADRLVTVRLPERIELFSTDGDRLILDSIDHDLPRIPRLDAEGMLRFQFGGRLLVEGDAEGDYRGEVPIIAEYL